LTTQGVEEITTTEAKIIKEVEGAKEPLKTSFQHGREGNRPEWLRTSHR
jgi:hypothetical protein